MSDVCYKLILCILFVSQQAKSEAAAAFGNDGVYLEKYVQNPRHIEFQVISVLKVLSLWLAFYWKNCTNDLLKLYSLSHRKRMTKNWLLLRKLRGHILAEFSSWQITL